jgi:hypothetical protein
MLSLMQNATDAQLDELRRKIAETTQQIQAMRLLEQVLAVRLGQLD